MGIPLSVSVIHAIVQLHRLLDMKMPNHLVSARENGVAAEREMFGVVHNEH